MPIEVPEWRRGAIYWRPLRDEDGAATGQEVTIYPEVDGTARVCVGEIGCAFFEHEWKYRNHGDAVNAVQDWTVEDHPRDFVSYRSAEPGNPIPTEQTREYADEERQQVMDEVVESQFPVIAKSMRRLVGNMQGATGAITTLTNAFNTLYGDELSDPAMDGLKSDASKGTARRAQHGTHDESFRGNRFPPMGKGNHVVTIEKSDEVEYRELGNEVRCVVVRARPLTQQIMVEQLVNVQTTQQIGWKIQTFHATLQKGGHDFKVGARFRANLVSESDELFDETAYDEDQEITVGWDLGQKKWANRDA